MRRVANALSARAIDIDNEGDLRRIYLIYTPNNIS